MMGNTDKLLATVEIQLNNLIDEHIIYQLEYLLIIGYYTVA